MTPPRFTVVGTDGTFVSGRAPLREDAAVNAVPRSEAERRDEPTDRIRSLTLQLQAETKAEREAFIGDIAQAVIKARRIALEDHHPVGIREFARQTAEYLGARLDSARAILEREP